MSRYACGPGIDRPLNSPPLSVSHRKNKTRLLHFHSSVRTLPSTPPQTTPRPLPRVVWDPRRPPRALPRGCHRRRHRQGPGAGVPGEQGGLRWGFLCPCTCVSGCGRVSLLTRFPFLISSLRSSLTPPHLTFNKQQNQQASSPPRASAPVSTRRPHSLRRPRRSWRSRPARGKGARVRAYLPACLHICVI